MKDRNALFFVALCLIESAVIAPMRCRAADARPDCGTMTLFTILRLEGREGRLADVALALPNRSPEGYSMLELKRAAQQLGVPLEAGVLRPGQAPPDRPILALLRPDRHGHFVVVRPVGHTRKLVQILDPAEGPRVLDATELYQMEGWTGMALRPRRRGSILRSLLLMSAVAIFLLTIVRLRIRRD